MKKIFSALAALERHPRLNPGVRILMAIFGAYAVAWLGAAALASGLPLPKSDAVTLAVILAFVLFLLLVLWVFASATLMRAALGLLAPVALFSGWLTLGAAAVATAAPTATHTEKVTVNDESPQTGEAATGASHAGHREGQEGRASREGRESWKGREGREGGEVREGREGRKGSAGNEGRESREGHEGRGGRHRAEPEPQ